MGVEYRGVLCVGYTYKEAEQLYESCEDENGDYKYEDFYDFCEEEELTSYSPYYDASKEHCIYGDAIESSGDYSYEVVSDELDERIRSAAYSLKERFGVMPKTYIMAHGW